MILREDRGSIAVLRMQHGKVNAIDLEFFSALKQELEQLEQSSSKAIILTGTGNAFSAGVDLFRVLESGPDYVGKFLPLLVDGLRLLFLHPKPVVAAINGHAIAGGCLLACAADHRIAAAGAGTMGIPELLVGVPFPPLAFEIARFAVAPQHLQKVVYSGAYYSMEQAQQLGMIDEIVSGSDLLDHACAVAAKLSSIPEAAFRFTKLQLRTPYVESAKKFGRSDEELLKLWTAPETHQVVRAYLEKIVRKKQNN